MSCPIYIINLKRNPERRLYMQRQLDAFGLDYRFVEVDVFDKYELESKACRIRIAQMLGIDEQTLENKYTMVINSVKNNPYVKNRPESKYHELAALAIGLSHIKVYNLMIENNHEMACILEDDAKLLPTFPEVLKTVPALEWNILQFCHQPVEFSLLPVSFIHCDYKVGPLTFPNLLFLLPKNYGEIDRQIIREYGFDNPKYSKLATYITKTMRLYHTKCKSTRPLIHEIIVKIFIPKIIKRFLIPKSLLLRINRIWSDRERFDLNTTIELGMFPEEPNPNLITKHHCIAKPRGPIVSTTAYLIRQSAIAKLKQELLSEHSLVVDQIPWQLYKNGQVKLCIISPPCVTATYRYLKYTMRRSDILTPK